ncbi:hypothetical protein F4825DRAFT_446351 [Nemania diffusa]|nr:hypothetical protein F4825DRAFT_446351 [Nemania diffusa]
MDEQNYQQQNFDADDEYEPGNNKNDNFVIISEDEQMSDEEVEQQRIARCRSRAPSLSPKAQSKPFSPPPTRPPARAPTRPGRRGRPRTMSRLGISQHETRFLKDGTMIRGRQGATFGGFVPPCRLPPMVPPASRSCPFKVPATTVRFDDATSIADSELSEFGCDDDEEMPELLLVSSSETKTLEEPDAPKEPQYALLNIQTSVMPPPTATGGAQVSGPGIGSVSKRRASISFPSSKTESESCSKKCKHDN